MSNKDIAYDTNDANYKKIKFHIPLLSDAGATTTATATTATATATTNTYDNHDDYDYLQGDLYIPYSSAAESLKSLIIFAHGGSSGRNSVRNRFVSHILNNNGFATLLTDLLTTNEVNSGKKNQMIMDKDRKEE